MDSFPLQMFSKRQGPLLLHGNGDGRRAMQAGGRASDGYDVVSPDCFGLARESSVAGGEERCHKE